MTSGPLYLLIAVSTVATVIPLSQPLGQALPPFTVASLRLALAAVVFLPVLIRHRTELAATRRRDRALLVGMAVCGTVGYTVTTVLALRHLPAVSVGIVHGALPAAVALGGWALLDERLTRRRLAVIGLACAGIVAVPLASFRSPGVFSLAGIAWALAGVVGESLFLILSRRLAQPLPPLAVAALMCALGAGLSLPFALVEAPAITWSTLPATVWAMIGYYALGPTVIGYWCWFAGIARTPAGIAAPFTAAIPVGGAVMAALWLGETITSAQGFGLALVALAILLNRA